MDYRLAIDLPREIPEFFYRDEEIDFLEKQLKNWESAGWRVEFDWFGARVRTPTGNLRCIVDIYIGLADARFGNEMNIEMLRAYEFGILHKAVYGEPKWK